MSAEETLAAPDAALHSLLTLKEWLAKAKKNDSHRQASAQSVCLRRSRLIPSPNDQTVYRARTLWAL